MRRIETVVVVTRESIECACMCSITSFRVIFVCGLVEFNPQALHLRYICVSGFFGPRDRMAWGTPSSQLAPHYFNVFQPQPLRPLRPARSKEQERSRIAVLRSRRSPPAAELKTEERVTKGTGVCEAACRRRDTND